MGCCQNPVDPVLNSQRQMSTGSGQIIEILKSDIVSNSSKEIEELSYDCSSPSSNIIIEETDSALLIKQQEERDESSIVEIIVGDSCGTSSSIEVEVSFELAEVIDGCEFSFVYPDSDNASSVSVAGDFNDWTAQPMALENDQWVLTTEPKKGLPPTNHRQ